MNRTECKLILTLSKAKELSMWQILEKNSAIPKTIGEALKALIAQGLVGEKNKKFFLTANGKQKAKEASISKSAGELAKEFNNAVKERQALEADYWQGRIATKDILKKLFELQNQGDLFGKSFLVLGDDDFFSIALALTGLPQRIVAVDISERVLNHIGKKSKEIGLKIETMKYNVEESFPKELAGKFDVVITEPVETIEGFKIFMSRAAESLKKQGSVYVGLTRTESGMKKWNALEKILLEMGFAITNAWQDYSSYPKDEMPEGQDDSDRESISKQTGFELEKPGIDWFHSSLLRCEAFEKPKPLIVGEKRIGKALYEDDEILTFLNEKNQ